MYTHTYHTHTHTHIVHSRMLTCLCVVFVVWPLVTCSESVEEEVRVVFTDEVYQIEQSLGPAGANGSAPGGGGSTAC